MSTPPASSSSSTAVVAQANKLKEEGNRLFMKRHYREAIEMYTRALDKVPRTAIYHTNRALCHFKLQQWASAVDDCRRAVELEPHSVKAFFYMGQSQCEMAHYDEAVVNLQRAHELARELSENYGDEITRTIRNVKRRRWASMEEARVKQEVELQSYLGRLMLEDKERQISRLRATTANAATAIASTAAVAAAASAVVVVDANAIDAIKSEPPQPSTISPALDSSGRAEAAAAADSGRAEERDRLQLIDDIELEYQQHFDELTRLFAENDARRRKRDIPDYLCGKISFELMRDPVITPSGITYDRLDIQEHLHRVGRFDPVTRQELTVDQLIPNLSMKEVIENFVSENEWIDGAL